MSGNAGGKFIGRHEEGGRRHQGHRLFGGLLAFESKGSNLLVRRNLARTALPFTALVVAPHAVPLGMSMLASNVLPDPQINQLNNGIGLSISINPPPPPSTSLSPL